MDDDAAVVLTLDRILGAAVRTGRIAAVHALDLREVPVELSLLVDTLIHLNEVPCRRRERFMGLVLPLEGGRHIRRQVMPLFAGDHARAASAAPCNIVQHSNFLCHGCSPFVVLRNWRVLTHWGARRFLLCGDLFLRQSYRGGAWPSRAGRRPPRPLSDRF